MVCILNGGLLARNYSGTSEALGDKFMTRGCLFAKGRFIMVYGLHLLQLAQVMLLCA